MPLLAPGEPPAVTVTREMGTSDLFLVCDHASNLIPMNLGNLGLPEAELRRHIAWDIGAAGVSRRMSEMLDATLVEQGYSRLVIDANRQPLSPAAMPAISEVTEVPGNFYLSEEDRRLRVEEIFAPYHDTIDRLLDARPRRAAVPFWWPYTASRQPTTAIVALGTSGSCTTGIRGSARRCFLSCVRSLT